MNNTTDKGHEILIADLRDLLDEAIAWEFHDFKNNKYATPKIELCNKLRAMADEVISGKYDN